MGFWIAGSAHKLEVQAVDIFHRTLKKKKRHKQVRKNRGGGRIFIISGEEPMGVHLRYWGVVQSSGQRSYLRGGDGFGFQRR